MASRREARLPAGTRRTGTEPLLSWIRFDPVGRRATDGPKRLGLLIDDLDAPTRAAGAAAHGRAKNVDQPLAATAGRWLPGRLQRLRPLFDPAHPQACLHPETLISLIDQVSVKPHEAESVNERVDVETWLGAAGISGSDGDRGVHVKAASAWLLVLNDAGHKLNDRVAQLVCSLGMPPGVAPAAPGR